MSRKTSRSSRCCFLISLVLVTSGSVVAQYTDRLAGTWNNPESTVITSTVLDNLSRPGDEKAARVKRASSAGKRSSVSATATKINDASVQFRSTGTQLKTREIANLIDPGNPQVLAIMTTLLQEYEKGARAAGKPNDLALALSFFFATNASVYHDAGQPTDPQMLELRDTIAEALVEGNAMKGVTDRQKQEMYETLVLFTGFALAAYQEGKQGGNSRKRENRPTTRRAESAGCHGHLARQDHFYRSGTEHRARTCRSHRDGHAPCCSRLDLKVPRQLFTQVNWSWSLKETKFEPIRFTVGKEFASTAR